ncbi:ABC-type multidrug transport system, ATPase and permease component [Gottschalkia purinilytica]|uniref:ABC-type multidrug transport system, ATPase and permease component n=1 Tax=Gottschalkia purinilytica TaxID=1503 RepID=A0A0L0WF70_GOTPU|nr:ABC transporter ATP-binding protein [Gottschalkia purinilytica]KNF10076.1 ABC-type multidrug transport system, ATPase and permease component [Gottschalkia purinilytica]
MNLLKENKHVIKRILLLYKPYKTKLALIITCVTISSVISILYPLISKQIMDVGILEKNLGIVAKLSIITLLLTLIDMSVGFIGTRYRSYLASVITYDLHRMVFKHLLKLKVSFFRKIDFTEEMNNINIDINNISKVSDQGILFTISQIFKMIGGFLGLTLIDWRLSLIIILIIPIRYSFMRYFAMRKKKLVEDYIDYNKEYSSWYEDTINGIKDIKLFGTDRIKIGEFIRKQRNIIKVNIKLASLNKANELQEVILTKWAVCLIYILGTYMIIQSKLSIGDLFAFVIYVFYVMKPISTISNIGNEFSNIIPSAKRLFEFFEIECETDEKEKGKLLNLNTDNIEGKIKFRNVTVCYKNGQLALDRVNFTINSGEKVAIICPNGESKSVILNIILRFVKPDSGNIFLDRTNINDIKLKEYRNLISFVSQDIHLFDKTIMENITLNLKADENKIRNVAKKSGVYDFISKMPKSYNTKVGSHGNTLSNIQKQNIAIARGLMKNFSVLLLDETTFNYDSKSFLHFNEILINEFKDKTVIVATHNLEILKRLDKIIVLKQGRIKDIGTHEELFKRSYEYQEIINYNIQRSKMMC